MHTDLKRAIVDYIIDNLQVFGLHNATTEKFKNYIYTPEGEYLIGGKQVAEFINQAIEVLV